MLGTLNSAFEVFRELSDRRVIEEIGDFELAGVDCFDALVNLCQSKRAGAELENIVVHADWPVGQERIANFLRLRSTSLCASGMASAACVVNSCSSAIASANSFYDKRRQANSAGSCRLSSSAF